MVSMTVTATLTEYTVTVTGGPATPFDWVGVYLLGPPIRHSSYLVWKFLPPGQANATLTFDAQTEPGSYECRLFENNSYNLLATALVPPPSTVSGVTGYFDVMDFMTPGRTETDAVEAAAAACKATASSWGSKGLYSPPGFNPTCTRPIDFRGISTIRWEGWLNYSGAVDGPCFKIGQPSQNTGGKYEFFGLYSFSGSASEMRHPLIQFSGLRGGWARIGVCNSFVEVYAGPGAYESTAYSEFHLGQTWRLELRSEATPANATSGWINSNQFYGGAMGQIRIGGPWVFVTSIVGTTVTTATPHNLATGQLVEMYNGTPADGAFRIITVTGATTFTLSSVFAGAGNAGNGWRIMGPSGYPHNDNSFNNPDIEDSPAIIHIQGQFNRLKECRMEADGIIAFGPQTLGNSVEASNSDHGFLPGPTDFDMTVMDFSAAQNYTGWVRQPKPWGE